MDNLPFLDEGGEVGQLPPAALQVVRRRLPLQLVLPPPDAQNALGKDHPAANNTEQSPHRQCEAFSAGLEIGKRRLEDARERGDASRKKNKKNCPVPSH